LSNYFLLLPQYKGLGIKQYLTKLNAGCRIWDYEKAAVVNTFDNHNTPDKGVSKLCLLNELDDSLLLVASSTYFIAFECAVSYFKSFTWLLGLLISVGYMSSISMSCSSSSSLIRTGCCFKRFFNVQTVPYLF